MPEPVTIEKAASQPHLGSTRGAIDEPEDRRTCALRTGAVSAVDQVAPELGEGVRFTDTTDEVLFRQQLQVVPGREVQQGSFTSDLDKHFRDMDTRQVDVQMLSISPQIFAYNLEPDVSVRVCRLLTD